MNMLRILKLSKRVRVGKMLEQARTPVCLGMLAGLALWPTVSLLNGCASLSAGADPFVVRIEQGESGATSTFDFVLHEDNANRDFWITNAPAFHNFCQWLRTPQDYHGTNVSRSVAMQLNVDDLKVTYRASKTAGSSNLLFSAFGVLDTAIGQAGAWQKIVTTSTHP